MAVPKAISSKPGRSGTATSSCSQNASLLAATWTQAGSWLDAFCQDTRTVLQAELELRLKPVAGLLAAMTTDAPGATNETPSP